MARSRSLALLVVTGLVVAACSGDATPHRRRRRPPASRHRRHRPRRPPTDGPDDRALDRADRGRSRPPAATDRHRADHGRHGRAAPLATLDVAARAGQVAVLDAEPGWRSSWSTADGEVADAGAVDEQGRSSSATSHRGATPCASDDRGVASRSTSSTPADVPPPSLLRRPAARRPAGSATSRPATAPRCRRERRRCPAPPEDGPVPDVVEYSGYDPSNPSALGFAQLFTALGYAYVGVNMRGTGCSGGSYRFFEDAADARRLRRDRGRRRPAVGARQPGRHGRHLATPASASCSSPRRSRRACRHHPAVGDRRQLPRRRSTRAASSTPGSPSSGPSERLDETAPQGQALDGRPASTPATPRAPTTRTSGCRTPTSSREIRDNPFYDRRARRPARAGARSSTRSTCPCSSPGAWQDEQTGGHFADDARPVHRHRPLLRHAHQRPAHRVDRRRRRSPRFVEFLDLYVAKRMPSLDSARGDRARSSPASIFGTDQITLPPDRFAGMTYERGARRVRGRAADRRCCSRRAPPRRRCPGARCRGSPAVFDVVAAAGASTATPWYLGADGTLGRRRRPEAAGATSVHAPTRTALPATFFRRRRQSEIWRTDVQWRLAANRRTGTAPRSSAPPLDADTVMVGSALGRPVDPHRRRRHRPRGDAQRDPARRPGDLRPERMAARQPARARRGRQHRAAAGAHPPRGRRRAAARRRVDAGARRAVPVRPRVPRRARACASPSTRRATAAPVGVRDDRRRRDGRDRPRAGSPVAGRAARRSPASTSPTPSRRAPSAASRAARRRSSRPAADGPGGTTTSLTVGPLWSTGSDGRDGGRGRAPSWASSSACGGSPSPPEQVGPAARAGPAHPGPAPRGGGAAGRRVGHLVHVARAGPADQRLRRRAAGDRPGAAPRRRRPGPPPHAGPPGRRRARTRRPPTDVPSALRRLIDAFEPAPAYVLGPHWSSSPGTPPRRRLYPPLGRPRGARAQPALGAVRPPRRRAT